MNAISCRCRTINRGYNRAVINILKFDTHLVVGCAIAAGDVAANHSLAIAFENLIHSQSLAMRIRSFTMSVMSLTLKCKLLQYLLAAVLGILFRSD